VDGFFHGAQVGQRQFGLDHFDVVQRADLAGHVDHVVIFEAAHHVDDGVGFADVRQELVAQAFALEAPATRPAMSTNSTMAAGCARLDDLGQRGQRGSGTSTTPTLGSMVQNG
jgi:hypothetical protein